MCYSSSSLAASDSGQESDTSGDFNDGQGLDTAGPAESGDEENAGTPLPPSNPQQITSPSDDGERALVINRAVRSSESEMPSVEELMLADMMSMTPHDQEVDDFLIHSKSSHITSRKSRLPSVDSAVHVIGSPVEFSTIPQDYYYHSGSYPHPATVASSQGVVSSTGSNVLGQQSRGMTPSSYQLQQGLSAYPSPQPPPALQQLYHQRMSSPVFNVSFASYTSACQGSMPSNNQSSLYSSSLSYPSLSHEFLGSAGSPVVGLESQHTMPVTTDTNECLGSLPSSIAFGNPPLQDRGVQGPSLSAACTPVEVATPPSLGTGLVPVSGIACNSCAVETSSELESCTAIVTST